MSDINLDFTVSNNSIGFTVQPNDITITPEEIQLTFAQGILSLPGGSNTQLQYNNNNTLDGIPNVTFNGSNISLGNVSTVKITGGTNGFVLQTDGTGNLDWTAMSGGGGGNGTPGGSNTQIQYNDAGAFGGNTGFTFNEVTGNVAIPGNLSVVGSITGTFFVANANFANFAGTVTTAAQGNITSVGTLTSLGVSGNITAANITANTGVFTGNGSALTALNGSNISTGTLNQTRLANASVTLGSTALTLGSTVTTVAGLSSVTSTTFVGALTGAATSATTAGTVTTNAQPNITSIGTLTDLFVSNATIHLGLNTGLGVSYGVRTIAIGANAGYTTQGDESVSIGANAGVFQSSRAVAIGRNAGAMQGGNAIAIGTNAGSNNQIGNAIAIGTNAGLNNQSANSIAIGTGAGTSNLGISSIAIGARSDALHNFAAVINATGANVLSTQANSLFVKPIRDVTGNASFTKTLKYNPTSGEIGYV